jgi:dipeptidase D
MSYVFEGLSPQPVWQHFYKINQIPRCSRNEEGARNYVKKFAAERNLTFEEDKTGNIVIRKAASAGMEKKAAIVIQGHLDMVCEKNRDIVHDFTKDAIKMYVEDGWIKAAGTTLGADNAIGVSMGLALLEDNTIAHPPLEILLTVDEETGLNGAVGLQEGMLKGKILLNLDTEEEHVLCVGCAGGVDTIMNKKIEWINLPDGFRAYEFKIKGLRGGHSGADIIRQFGNAIKLTGRLLYKFSEKNEFYLAAVNGGSAHNAIPREAEAIIVLNDHSKNVLDTLCEDYQMIFNEELSAVEKNITISLEPAAAIKKVFHKSFTSTLIRFLNVVPHGVMTMSQRIENLVETSTNMAVVKTTDDNLYVQTSQRSSVPSSIWDIAAKVRACGEIAGFKVEHEGGYPPWPPDFDSPLLKTCVRIYKEQFAKEPHIQVIHAGLECGIIGEKNPGMDMISFGPDITGAHSPDEKVRIESVAKIWDFLLKVIKDL